MLSAAARSRLVVVLVGARNPGNIGAAARAMQDFGFNTLRLVNDFAAPFEAAQLEAKSAVGAANVMASAVRFDSLAAAIGDCALVVATTAIGERETRVPVLSFRNVAPRILEALSIRADEEAPGTALLFGSEKTGLTNEQFSHCSLLTTIPMFAPESARHLSMNLGQSVAVCLYELSRGGFEGVRALPERHDPLATAADRHRLTMLLLDVLSATGYARRFPANSDETVIRQLVQSLGGTHKEAMTWMGILRQILWRERGDRGANS